MTRLLTALTRWTTIGSSMAPGLEGWGFRREGPVDFLFRYLESLGFKVLDSCIFKTSRLLSLGTPVVSLFPSLFWGLLLEAEH